MRLVIAVSAILVFAPALSHSDEPCPCAAPPAIPPLTGSVGAGLAKTGGNTDTLTINATAAVQWDPKTHNVVKVSAFYLRGETAGNVTVSQATLDARDEYHLSDRAFVFADVSDLHDRFKQVSYLVSGLAGVGYKMIKTSATGLAVDGAIGGTLEEDLVPPRRTSGAYHVGETFSHKISTTATISQTLTALWKTTDSTDALYHFDASLAAAVTRHSDLKVSFVDDIKNKPVAAGIKKSDTAVLMAYVMKF
jgi:putative salt-induced outer membrane protein